MRTPSRDEHPIPRPLINPIALNAVLLPEGLAELNVQIKLLPVDGVMPRVYTRFRGRSTLPRRRFTTFGLWLAINRGRSSRRRRGTEPEVLLQEQADLVAVLGPEQIPYSVAFGAVLAA